MKRCPRCGSEFPDEYQLCTRDMSPLVPAGQVAPPLVPPMAPLPGPVPRSSSSPAVPLLIVGAVLFAVLFLTGIGWYWISHIPPSPTPEPSGGSSAASGGEVPPSSNGSASSAASAGETAPVPSSSGSGPENIPETPPETEPSAERQIPEKSLPAPQSDVSKRLLTEADLEGKTAWDLTLMRNEPYARHGYHLHLNKKVAAYFESQPWYHPTTDDMGKAERQMSEVERKNTSFILDYQTRHNLLLK